MSSLAALAAAEPELRAYAVADPGPDRFAHASVGPERAFVLEAVYEAYLLHYAEPRAFRGLDEDLLLLAGDALYARGLARLARNEDLEAVAELAELITACARAHAENRPELVEALWAASVSALSAGGGPGASALITKSLAPTPRLR